MCSDTPGTGNHIECVEESSSTDDIDINATGIDIDFTATGNTFTGGGVHAWHKGNANVDINISGKTNADMTTTPSTIDTTGSNSHGISGKLFGDGALTITLQDTAISTHGATAFGLRADHQGTGDLTVDLRAGTTINTHGSQGAGAYLIRQEQAAGEGGDIILKTDGISVRTEWHGLYAFHQNGIGDVMIDVMGNSEIVTTGPGATGVRGY